ncbi:hypothetical protein, partial [Paractinoplanes toevensis]|uniref:hypothetical protein n=1 Tax=Paractinoplanes toevensis TaxID=571911 RepID=UPI001BB37F2B
MTADWRALDAAAADAFDRFAETQEPAFADLAVEGFRAVCALVPGTHADRTRHLANLAVALVGRFERIGTPADLDEAVLV